MKPLFLLACIPSRLLLAWASTKIPKKYLILFGLVLLTMALSFLWLYFTGGRLSAPEAGGKTWWAQYRLIIGLLYMAAAIYALQGRQELVWIPIIIDLVFGVILTL